MLVEPADLATDTVLALVREHWDDGVLTVTHLPRGAGAHHWAAAGRRRPRWFVTADDVSTAGRDAELQDTYAAARRLAERGMYAVVPTVAPVSDRSAVGVRHGRFLVTVTAYLEGEPGTGEYADDNQRALIAHALGVLHAARPPRRTRLWSPGPPLRAELTALSGVSGEQWKAGPFGESVRAALCDNEAALNVMMKRFDELAGHALSRRQGWVPTHGEPHTANVLWTLAGPVLVDWESLRVAPRERDLRTVLREADGAEPLSAYVASGGTVDLDADLVELFDLEWWLWEVASCAVRFHEPHDGNADDERFHRAFLAEVVPAVGDALA